MKNVKAASPILVSAISPVRQRSNAGRPKKNLKDFNLPKNWKETVYKMSAQGCSEVEIRAHFLMLGGKFSQVTWDALKEREAEFLLTIQQSKILCQAWWEKMSRKSLKSKNFQTGSWYANMKNRFGWYDKNLIDHQVSDETVNLLRKYESIDITEFKNRVSSSIGSEN